MARRVLIIQVPDDDEVRYIDVTGNDAYCRTMLALLRERVAEGSFAPGPIPTQPSISREFAEALPEGQTRRCAQREWAAYDDGCRLRAALESRGTMADLALKAGDATSAEEILRLLAIGRGEVLKIVTLEELTGSVTDQDGRDG